MLADEFNGVTPLQRYTLALQERVDSLTDEMHVLREEIKQSRQPPPFRVRLTGEDYARAWCVNILSHREHPLDVDFLVRTILGFVDADVIAVDNGIITYDKDRDVLHFVEAIVRCKTTFIYMPHVANYLHSRFDAENARFTRKTENSTTTNIDMNFTNLNEAADLVCNRYDLIKKQMAVTKDTHGTICYRGAVEGSGFEVLKKDVPDVKPSSDHIMNRRVFFVV